ncbi:hypothetical protein BAE44_0021694, partial [Dichanthelium oligosanthes]
LPVLRLLRQLLDAVGLLPVARPHPRHPGGLRGAPQHRRVRGRRLLLLHPSFLQAPRQGQTWQGSCRHTSSSPVASATTADAEPPQVHGAPSLGGRPRALLPAPSFLPSSSPPPPATAACPSEKKENIPEAPPAEAKAEECGGE